MNESENCIVADNSKNDNISAAVREKDERIAKLTRAVELLQYEKSKSSFLQGFLKFMSKNYSYEELIKETVFFFRQEFRSVYSGVFIYSPEEYCFTYLFGSGYKPSAMPVIDESGSIMGEAVHSRDTVLVEDMKERYFHIPLNQMPPEYNVVCVPVFTSRKTLVFRIANVPDKKHFAELSTVLTGAADVLAKTLDQIYQNTMNQQALRGVQFSLAISRLMEKTLERRDILHFAFGKICGLMDTAVHMIATKENADFIIIEKSKPDFYLGGSPAAHAVYLRNLAESFPEGSGFVENVHKIPRWSWSNMHYYSLHLAPLTIEKRLVGTLISVSVDDSFTEGTCSLLKLAASQTSITMERAYYFRQQEDFASKDGLTGLFNRRMFDSVLSSETAVAGRYKRPLSMIILDIDHFKKFNDTYGHKTGDEVLQLVSRTIGVTIRTSDRAFRYGGEEFVIMCPETNGENTALVAERLRQRVEMTRTSGGLQVAISLGVTQYINGESEDHFVKRADSLLYHSKENGRNRVTLG